jgi:hypothetical protein
MQPNPDLDYKNKIQFNKSQNPLKIRVLGFLIFEK